MKRTPRPHPPSAASLFHEPERPASVHVANVDGASRGNPGPASYAVVVRRPDGTTLFEIGKYLGRATNNVAEYYALITALDYAATQHIDRLLVRSDSELLVRQMQGRYKVKSPDLRPLYERAQKLARGLAHFTIEHVPREMNGEADELANLALDRTSSQSAYSAPAASQAAQALAQPHVTQPHIVQPHDPQPHTAQTRLAQPRIAQGAVAAVPESRGGERRLRARYSAGALHPLEALDLAEGEIVEIAIRKNDRG